MTKFARLRVDVPVDDGLAVLQVRDHLQALLEGRNTETLDLPEKAPNGEDAELPGDLPRKGRIHWPAVDVVLAAERAPPPPAPPKKRGTRDAAG